MSPDPQTRARNDHTREPEAPPSLRRWVRLAVYLALPIVLILVAVVAPAPAPASGGAEPAALIEPAAKAEVRVALNGLRGSLVPGQVAPLPCESDQDRVRYRSALAEFLTSTNEPLFDQAVQLAVQQGQTELVPQLRAALAHAPEPFRQELVLAVERLEPWTDQDLDDLLRAPSPGTVLAALRIAGARPEPPVDAILPHLVDPLPAIRAAALAAAPAQLSADAGSRILAAQRGVPADQAGEALAALVRCPPSAEIDDALWSQVERQGEHCDTVLDALAQSAAPLSRPEAVLRIVQDASAPVRTRGRALRCLETTGTLAGVETFEQARLRHPVLDYGAARVLLAARRPSGVELLLEILRAPDEGYDEADAQLVQEARLGARQLLAALADTSVNAELEEWAEWWARRPQLVFDRLPASSLALDG